MDRSLIISRLRDYEHELKAAGIQPSIDVIADFDASRKMSLLRRAHLENLLTDILDVKADLADRKMMRREIRETAERESVLVF
ncbi:MAG TPA: hypothetical protein VK789_13860 [Bryobacteraceae bacterium]|jgi:predicted nucleotidyltransferase|nr:hypothetical protein [Bryobacteraceae bacterium]